MEVQEEVILSQTVRPTRKRKITSPEGLIILEELYSATSTPMIEQLEEVSQNLNWSVDRVKVWFSNKRANLKYLKI